MAMCTAVVVELHRWPVRRHQRGSSPQKPYGENLFASSHSKETLHFEKLSAVGAAI